MDIRGADRVGHTDDLWDDAMSVRSVIYAVIMMAVVLLILSTAVGIQP